MRGIASRAVGQAVALLLTLSLVCEPLVLQAQQAPASTQYLFRMQGVIDPQPALLIAGPSPVNGHVMTALQATYTLSNAFGPVQWSATGLPDGLLIANGIVSGVPLAMGTYQAVLMATDSAGNTAELPVEFDIFDQLRIIDVYDVYGKVQQPLTIPAPPVVGNPVAPLTWSLASGYLPLGLSLNATTGVISGTPLVSGIKTISLAVRDATAATAVSATFTIDIDEGLPIATIADMQGRVDIAFASPQPVVVNDGVAPFTWSLLNGNLPEGLSLDPSTGIISGVPTVIGNQSNLVLAVTDAHGSVGDSNAFTISILPGVQFTTQQADVNLRQNYALDSPIVAPSLNTPLLRPFQWFVSGGNLPEGLLFNTSIGSFTGIPSLLGSTEMTIGAIDGSGEQVLAPPFSITVLTPLTIAAPQPFTARVGDLIALPAPSITGGPDAAATITAPGLPGYLSVDPLSGAITGLALTAASGSFSYVLADPTPHQSSYAVSSPASASFQILGPLTAKAVNPVALVAAPDGSYMAHVGTTVSLDFAAGPQPTGTVTWAVLGGSLPPGTALAQDVNDPALLALQGTLSTIGTYSFVLQATDASGLQTAPATFVVIVYPPLAGTGQTITVNAYQPLTAPLPVAVPGTAITTPPSNGVNLAFVGTDAPGLVPVFGNAVETIGGAVALPGTYQITWLLTDQSTTPGVLVSDTLVVKPSYALTVPSITAHVGQPVQTGPPGIDPAAALPVSAFQLVDPAGLPAGLSFDPASGTFSGTPVQATNGVLTGYYLTATDANGAALTGAFTIDIEPALVLPGSGGFFISRVGVPMLPIAPLQPDSGTAVAPLQFALASGSSLPSGVTVDPASGIVSGTATDPASAGLYQFSLSLTDATGATAVTPATTLEVLAPLAIDSIGNQTFALATPMSYTPIALNAPGIEQSPACNPAAQTCNVTWTLSGSPDVATLQALYGLSFDPVTGQLSGTPMADLPASAYSLVVSDDQGAQSPPMSFTLTLTSAYGGLAIDNPPPSYVGDPHFGTPAPAVPAAAVAPLTWEVATGVLPPGVHLDIDGSLSGVPAAAATDQVSLVLTDATGAVWTSNLFTVVVNNAMLFNTPGGSVPELYFRIGVDGPITTARIPTVTYGTPPVTWSYSGGDPTAQGLTFDSANGQFSGTPAGTATAYALTYQVSDSGVHQQHLTSAPFTLSILDPLQFPAATPCDAASGAVQCTTLTVGLGTTVPGPPKPVVMPVGSLFYQVVAGSLPPGLLLLPENGQLTGTPTALGTYPVTLTATDLTGATTQNTWTELVTVTEAIVVGSLSDPLWRATSNGTNPGYGLVHALDGFATPDSLPLPAVTGAPANIAWSTAPAYPWLNIVKPTLFGTPPVAGTFMAAVVATDPATGTASASNAATIVVLPPLLLSSLPDQTSTVSAPVSLSAPDVSGDPQLPLHWHALNSEIDYYQPDGSQGGVVYVLNNFYTAFGNCVCSFDPDGPMPFPPPAGWTSVTTNFALPQGITVASNGAITGGAVQSGQFTSKLLVDDATGGFATSNAFTWTVSPGFTLGSVKPPSLRYGTPMPPYSIPVLGSLYGSANWVVSSGALPAGLSLDPASGVISGTPSSLGPASAVISVTDASGANAAATLNLDVLAPLQIAVIQSVQVHQDTLADIPGPTVMNDPVLPVTWSVAAGYTMPDGLSISPSDGSISGVATTVGVTPMEFKLVDAQGATASLGVFSIYVLPPLAMAMAPDLNFHFNLAETAPPPALLNAATPVHWSLQPTALPDGLHLLATAGSISGTVPGTAQSTASSASYVYVATDALGGIVSSNAFNLNVTPSILAYPPTALQGRYGVAASFVSTALYAAGAVSWSLVDGSLPPGLNLNDDGSITGVPQGYGSFPVNLAVTDASGSTAETGTFTLVIDPALAIEPEPSLVVHVGSRVNQPPPLIDNTPVYPLQFSLASGALPPGLQLNASGTLTGMPTAPATATVSLSVTDATGATATSAPFTCTVDPAMTIDVPALTSFDEFTLTPEQFSVENAVGSVTWTASGLPAGMTLSSAGALTGAASVTGVFTVQLTATDSINGSASLSFPLTVLPALALIDPSQQQVHVGQAADFAAPALVNPPINPLTWSLSQGTLPPGLSLNADGSISGTPTAAADVALRMTVVDAAGATATTDAYDLQVLPAMTLASLPNVIVHQNITLGQIEKPLLSNDLGPDTWVVSAGALPAGLLLSTSDGIVSGTPTAPAGVYATTLRVTDHLAASLTSNSFQTTIVGPLTIATPVNAYVNTGQALSWTPPIVNNQAGTLTWSLKGDLPNGISFNTATGALTGTPLQSTSATYNLVLVVTDSAQGSATSPSFVLTVTAPATLAAPAALTGHGGDAIAFAAPLVGGSPAYPVSYRMNAASTALPAGVSINSATGVISGTGPVVASTTTSTFKIDMVDAAAVVTTSPAFTLTQLPPLSGTALPATVTLHVTQPFSQPGPVLSNALGGVTWTASNLPAGLSLNAATGSLSGPATALASAVAVTLTATDSSKAAHGTLTYNQTLTVDPALTLGATAAVFGFVGSPLTMTAPAVSHSVGTTVYALSGTGASGATPPNGLNFSTSTGSFSGTPTSAGGFGPYTVSVTDATGTTVASNAFSVTIGSSSSIAASNTYPSAVSGQTTSIAALYDNSSVPASTMSFTAAGQTETFTYAQPVRAGDVSVTPSGSYSYSYLDLATQTWVPFTPSAQLSIISTAFQMTNLSASSTVVSQAEMCYSATCALALPSMTPQTSIPAFGNGGPVSQNLDVVGALPVSNGSGTLSWSLLPGTGTNTLPNGLSLSSAGLLTGTPATSDTVTTTYTAEVVVTDSRGIASVAQPYAMQVAPYTGANTLPTAGFYVATNVQKPLASSDLTNLYAGTNSKVSTTTCANCAAVFEFDFYTDATNTTPLSIVADDIKCMKTTGTYANQWVSCTADYGAYPEYWNGSAWASFVSGTSVVATKFRFAQSTNNVGYTLAPIGMAVSYKGVWP